MFFSPAIVGMLELGASVHIECLSNGKEEKFGFTSIYCWVFSPIYIKGNYDGLGRVREKELVASCEILGVTGPDHVRCIEDERLQDHSSVGWDAEVVAETVDAAVKRVNATMVKKKSEL